MRTVGLRGVLQRIDDCSARRLASDGHAAFSDAAACVSRAYRWSPLPDTCLRRALVQYWMHRREGVAARLFIGVKRAAAQLEAHAWLEYEGVANDGTRPAEFSVVLTLPADARGLLR